jgi:hypothetical protein
VCITLSIVVTQTSYSQFAGRDYINKRLVIFKTENGAVSSGSQAVSRQTVMNGRRPARAYAAMEPAGLDSV